MNRKYLFINESRLMVGHKLHRVRALKDVEVHAKTGELGGWIESEGNLSETGDAPGLPVRYRRTDERRYLVMRRYSEARL